MNKKILVIDDDQKLNKLLKGYLAKFGFEVDTVDHPHAGLAKIKQEPPDLIILDVMLPDMEGFEVCKEIRKNSSTPIIMLTARGEVTDRIVGLELGADDYLPKPFEPRELVARMQTVLRRGETQALPEIKRFGSLTVDFRKHSATIDGNPIELTTAEFEILSLFVNNPWKLLNRDNLLDHLRGIEWDVFSRSVDVLVSRLRQKLNDDPKNPRFIKTVWGSGYKFIGEENED
ncbi:MAG: DNA-binding response regulator [Calditrichaeota bacterium]|nr:MAG: DNA-binding response regulator [Calditrichota bacterium]MBL1204108.1 DNA-binding response regulator [Calditrichota bacterium]NOG43939.1 response regulator transcription factor [Calditrichota bacterium]